MVKQKHYGRVYRLLCRGGHTSAKAIEIILLARRGNTFALDWIRAFRKMVPKEK